MIFQTSLIKVLYSPKRNELVLFVEQSFYPHVERKGISYDYIDTKKFFAKNKGWILIDEWEE